MCPNKGMVTKDKTAAANTVAIPATALVTQLVNALVASGGGDLDYSAIGTVLFALSEGAAKSGRG